MRLRQSIIVLSLPSQKLPADRAEAARAKAREQSRRLSPASSSSRADKKSKMTALQRFIHGRSGMRPDVGSNARRFDRTVLENFLPQLSYVSNVHAVFCARATIFLRAHQRIQNCAFAPVRFCVVLCMAAIASNSTRRRELWPHHHLNSMSLRRAKLTAMTMATAMTTAPPHLARMQCHHTSKEQSADRQLDCNIWKVHRHRN